MNNNDDFYDPSYDKPYEDELACGQPCSPDSACDECVGYWQNMIDQGFWDRERHRWTDKGWASITRSF